MARYGNRGGGGGILLLLAILVYFMFFKKSRINSLTHGILHILLASFNIWALVSYSSAFTDGYSVANPNTTRYSSTSYYKVQAVPGDPLYDAFSMQTLFTAIFFALGLLQGILCILGRTIYSITDCCSNADPGKIRVGIVVAIFICANINVLGNIALCTSDFILLSNKLLILWFGWFAFYAIFCFGTWVMSLRFLVRLLGKTTFQASQSAVILTPVAPVAPTPVVVEAVQPVYVSPPAPFVVQVGVPAEPYYAPPPAEVQPVYQPPPFEVVQPANSPNAGNLPVY